MCEVVVMSPHSFRDTVSEVEKCLDIYTYLLSGYDTTFTGLVSYALQLRTQSWSVNSTK
jgi:hypothetical protein